MHGCGSCGRRGLPVVEDTQYVQHSLICLQTFNDLSLTNSALEVLWDVCLWGHRMLSAVVGKVRLWECQLPVWSLSPGHKEYTHFFTFPRRVKAAP